MFQIDMFVRAVALQQSRRWSLLGRFMVCSFAMSLLVLVQCMKGSCSCESWSTCWVVVVVVAGRVGSRRGCAASEDKGGPTDRHGGSALHSLAMGRRGEAARETQTQTQSDASSFWLRKKVRQPKSTACHATDPAQWCPLSRLHIAVRA